MEQCTNLSLDLGKTKNSIRSITLMAMLLAVLIAQEELLVFIPQFQFTVILIVIFARYLKYEELIPLILAYVLLDNIIMGSLNFVYSIPMFISWPLLAIVAKTLQNKPDFLTFIWIVLFSFIYGWMFIPFNMIMFEIFDVTAYFLADLPFEMLFAASNIITFFLMFKPLTKLFDFYYKKESQFI